MTYSLNAPCGAGCFLTGNFGGNQNQGGNCLNAPCGAGCFLTPLPLGWRRCATSGGWGATGSASTPRDRPAPPPFNHFSVS